MPDLTSHESKTSLKCLLLGDSGAGKTGALASLAAAGYELFILDCDSGLDVLANLLNDPKTTYPKDCLERVHYLTIQEKTKVVGASVVPVTAQAWSKAVNSLMRWKDGQLDYGPVQSWGPEQVLVIDSLTFLSKYALNSVLAVNGRLGQHPQLQDWGAGQTLVEGLLAMITSAELRCHVVLICHVTYMGMNEGDAAKNELKKGYPSSLGRSLPPKIGQYFNTAIMAQGRPGGKREIITNSTGLVELKTSAPLRVAPRYPIETALADYFAAVLQTPGGKVVPKLISPKQLPAPVTPGGAVPPVVAK